MDRCIESMKIASPMHIGVSKKTEKPIKSRKREKNNRKNRTEKKNRLNRYKFWKNRLVRFGFGFISKKLKNRTETKPKKTGKNRAKPEKPSQNRENRAKPVWTGFGFFYKKNFGLYRTKNNHPYMHPSM